MTELLNHAAELFGVPASEIASQAGSKHRPRGSRQVVRARQAVAWVLWRKGMTLEAIGWDMGGRHHTTIMDGIRRAEARAKQDREYALLVSALL